MDHVLIIAHHHYPQKPKEVLQQESSAGIPAQLLNISIGIKLAKTPAQAHSGLKFKPIGNFAGTPAQQVSSYIGMAHAHPSAIFLFLQEHQITDNSAIILVS